MPRENSDPTPGGATPTEAAAPDLTPGEPASPHVAPLEPASLHTPAVPASPRPATDDTAASEARPAAASPDLEAAARMWAEYSRAEPSAVLVCDEHTVEGFGDSAALADELLGLVLSGRKRATAELTEEFAARGDSLPRVGSHWIACDSTGAPRAVLRSTELRLATFDEVDASFAFDEGEDDRSLESWRTEHARYWTRGCAARGAVWSPDQEIVLERFTVVWPPEAAETAAQAQVGQTQA